MATKKSQHSVRSAQRPCECVVAGLYPPTMTPQLSSVEPVYLRRPLGGDGAIYEKLVPFGCAESWQSGCHRQKRDSDSLLQGHMALWRDYGYGPWVVTSHAGDAVAVGGLVRRHVEKVGWTDQIDFFTCAERNCWVLADVLLSSMRAAIVDLGLECVDYYAPIETPDAVQLAKLAGMSFWGLNADGSAVIYRMDRIRWLHVHQ